MPKDPVKQAEYRAKMSRIAKERGYGKWMTGKKHTAESRQKMSAIKKAEGNTPEQRAQRAARARAARARDKENGRDPFSPEARAKARAVTTAQRKGRTYADIYGDRAAEEVRKRREKNRANWPLSDADPERREKHNADYRYREWREAVFARDDWTCRDCGVRGGRLEAHHIKSWRDHPEHRFDTDNGLTLCKDCHRLHTAKQTSERTKQRHAQRREAFHDAGVPDPTIYAN